MRTKNLYENEPNPFFCFLFFQSYGNENGPDSYGNENGPDSYGNENGPDSYSQIRLSVS